ncbi:MAG TPA: NUDIX domain-containing protein [archaeon]|nr:NUDIX domain-containing protein [archaeon]
MAKEILVVKRDALFNSGHFTGFAPLGEMDYLGAIRENAEYRERNDELENNPAFKQPIPYVWIINPHDGKVFAYKRAKKGYDEERLKDKWSCGLGGHVDKTDEGDALKAAMNRELREEVTMAEYPVPRVVGFVNFEHGVHAVHFGVVSVAEAGGPVGKGSEEMAECGFYSIEELESLMSDPRNDFEEWTTASWPFVKKLASGQLV